MKRELIKGNEAAVKGAILAGCTHYFGYPITPASEIAHAAARFMPVTGGTFIQAESEVAAINMVYGAAAMGRRAMTASSGPGLSLKQEGISYMAGADLPGVVIDVMRAGPGLGNIWPEQGDYNQIVKGGGHGNYRVLVLAPNSAQEMCDFTSQAFGLAEKYLGCVVILTDAYIGQMMEPVKFPLRVEHAPRQPWALYADRDSKHNLVRSIFFDSEILEKHNRELQERYRRMEREDCRWEDLHLDDADLIVVAYGITSRVALSAVENLRGRGKKVGMLRPITLFPFPTKRIQELLPGPCQTFLTLELSNGQMVDDVRLAVAGRKPVEFYGRMGGNVPSVEELEQVISRHLK